MEWTTSLEATVHPCRYDHHDLDEYDNDHHDYGDDIKGGLHLYSFPPRGGVIWRRLTPRTEHWKTRLPPSLTQWINSSLTQWLKSSWQPPRSLCGSVNSDHSVILKCVSDQKRQSDWRHPCGENRAVVLAPEDLEKSVILENFEEILKTCFDNTKFCDFPTPVLSPVPVLKRTKSIICSKNLGRNWQI